MNNFVKNATKYIVYALPAVALVVGNGMYFPFITGKAILFRVSVELAFFLYIALAISDKSYRPKWNAMTITFAIFTGVILLADIFAVDPSKAFWSNFERMDGFVTLAHLFIYFLVASSMLKNKGEWKVWIHAQAAIAIYMVYFCFLQLAGEAKINQGGVRVDGSLGNAAYLAVYLMFNLFFLLYTWLTEKVDFRAIAVSIVVGGYGYSIYYLGRIANKDVVHTSAGLWILLIAILISSVALILRLRTLSQKSNAIIAHASLSIISIAYLIVLYHTATRGPILGLIGGLYVTGLYLALRVKDNKHLRYGSIAVLAALSLAIGIFFMFKDTDFVRNSPVLSRFASLSLDTQGQARNYVWPMAIKGFKENPILGWGQEGFSYVFQKYYVPEMITQEPWFDRAHNSFLDWLVAGGIVGGLSYAALYIIALIYILRGTAVSSREKAVLLGLLSAYIFQSMLIFDSLLSYIFFVSLLALLSSQRSGSASVPEGRTSQVEGSLLGACVVVFFIVLLLVNAKPYMQNKALLRGISEPQVGGIGKNLEIIKKSIGYNPTGRYEARERLTLVGLQVAAAPNISDQDKGVFVTGVVEEMDKELLETPDDARAHLVYGDFLVSLGAYEKALPILERALELAPSKQQIMFTLARLYLSQAANDKDPKTSAEFTAKGLAVIKAAYELAPDLDPSRTPYISALIITGNIDEALPIIKEVEDPTPLVDTELVKALVVSGHVEETIVMLRKAIDVDRNTADAYTMIADVYIFLKQPQDAIAILEDMAEALPSRRSQAEAGIQTIKTKFKL